MNKPFVTCYMMTSADGRIDCAMTAKLPGVEDYYTLLKELNFDAAVSGRVTAELEMAEPGKFELKNAAPVGKEAVYKAEGTKPEYDVVVDTKGTLLWKDGAAYSNPLIILTSEQAGKEYQDYLKEKGISYIAIGKDHIDLARAADVLKETFGVEHLGIVGGAAIDTAFLDAGLLDEVILLIGAGIDGRADYPPVFNRKSNDVPLKPLKLMEAKVYPSQAVMLRYQVQNS